MARSCLLLAPRAVVSRFLTGGTLTFAHCFHFFRRAIAVVSRTIRQHLRQKPHDNDPCASFDNMAFILLQIQPVHTINNCFVPLPALNAFQIGVLMRSTKVPPKWRAKAQLNGSTSAAQATGWTWCKTSTHWCARVGICDVVIAARGPLLG